jgi:hypothetical protein
MYLEICTIHPVRETFFCGRAHDEVTSSIQMLHANLSHVLVDDVAPAVDIRRAHSEPCPDFCNSLHVCLALVAAEKLIHFLDVNTLGLRDAKVYPNPKDNAEYN